MGTFKNVNTLRKVRFVCVSVSILLGCSNTVSNVTSTALSISQETSNGNILVNDKNGNSLVINDSYDGIIDIYADRYVPTTITPFLEVSQYKVECHMEDDGITEIEISVPYRMTGTASTTNTIISYYYEEKTNELSYTEIMEYYTNPDDIKDSIKEALKEENLIALAKEFNALKPDIEKLLENK